MQVSLFRSLCGYVCGASRASGTKRTDADGGEHSGP